MPNRIARELIGEQKPTADNNYTWYKLYSDGWVEQGGTTGPLNNAGVVKTLAIPMVNSNYCVLATGINANTASNNAVCITNQTATTIRVATTANYGIGTRYYVSGISTIKPQTLIRCIKY